MNTYAMMAFEVTKSQHMTAEQVAAMGYADIAALAKVTDSPPGFEYRPVRRQVCELLLRKDRDDALATIKTAAENAVKLSADLSDAKLAVDEDGRLRVTSAKVTSDTEKATFSQAVHDWFETQGVNR